MPRKITSEDRERIVDLFENGMSRQDIQYEVGLTQPTIRKILKEAGYDPANVGKPTEITEEIKDAVVSLRNTGLSGLRIAEQLGIAKRTVYLIISERVDGIVSKRRGSISPHEFIKAWQESDKAIEVAKKLGLSLQAVYSRANTYKQRGVPLRRLNPGRAYDWDELAEFADMFLEEDED